MILQELDRLTIPWANYILIPKIMKQRSPILHWRETCISRLEIEDLIGGLVGLTRKSPKSGLKQGFWANSQGKREDAIDAFSDALKNALQV
jgi:hypothetical protein